jgi:hypothetical protein
VPLPVWSTTYLLLQKVTSPRFTLLNGLRPRAGSFFGEGALQKERYYHRRTAKALKDCDLTFLTKQEVQKIAEDYPVRSLPQQPASLRHRDLHVLHFVQHVTYVLRRGNYFQIRSLRSFASRPRCINSIQKTTPTAFSPVARGKPRQLWCQEASKSLTAHTRRRR